MEINNFYNMQDSNVSVLDISHHHNNKSRYKLSKQILHSRQRYCEQRGGGEQRAVVGIDVCDCCGLELRERGVQRAGARGARGVVER